MNITNKKIEELKPYKNNPRNNDKAVDKVAESIKEFGFKVPMVIDKNNEIITGHTRLKAAIKLGLKEVPCIIADDLNEDQIKAFRLIDNKVSEFSTWDKDLLQSEINDIINNGFSMEEFGFEKETNEPTIEKVKEVKNIKPDDLKPEDFKIKKNELWKLGNHYLYCGDSTKKEDVDKLLQNNKMDLVITDPPYNVAYNNMSVEEAKVLHRRTDNLTIKNDAMTPDEFKEFLNKAFKNIYDNLKDGGVFYIWYASKEVVNFSQQLETNNLPVREELIWNKSIFTFGRQDYQWKHEPCLYGWKEGAAHYFINDRTQSTILEDRDIDKLTKEELKDIVKQYQDSYKETTILNEDKPTRSSFHPTMKPIKLFARLIKNSSRKNEKVLDLFGGSGTTLLACEQLNRSCYIMEYDEKYANVIIKRWETLTNKKAEKVEVK